MTTAASHISSTPKTELPKSYQPSDWEEQILARWDAARAFHADPSEDARPYCILIPPPNVTAALHLGHAFNNTLQDILTRYHRMAGFKTLWMPGTDHAGIATQAVVEKRLLLQGKRRTDFSRSEFIAKVQAWKDEYEATIIEQLKSMGCSCDFERTRFTMDEVCAKAVREAFFRLFKDGLIYRGKRLVNWDPVSQTALADDEVEMEEVAGHMYYLRYPLANAETPKRQNAETTEYVTVATTRPETMLGDTAVAMNPKDLRAAQFVGRQIKLPIVDRIIPIIADDYVVMPAAMGGDATDAKAAIATGFLKVTPAHDPNDYEIRQRHPEIAMINVLAPDATISDKHGWPAEEVSSEARQFIGLSREEARKRIVQWFKDHSLLEDVKPYTHSVGHSYRSHVPIEPYLSDQWYVKVTDDRLRGEALRAMADDQREGLAPPPLREGAGGWVGRSTSEQSGDHSATASSTHPPALSLQGRGSLRTGDAELRFFPSRYAKTFQLWHENLRDWCISRQLWWGHRIPVWSIKLSGAHSSAAGAAPDLHFTNKTEELRNYLVACGFDHSRISIARSSSFTTSHILYLCCADSASNEAIAFLEWRKSLTPTTPARQAMHSMNAFKQRFGEAAYVAGCELDAKLTSLAQDPDVLDTWFSSALWPISTMGWPDPESFPREIAEGSSLLNTFNPSSVLLTAREIITLWVSRMVMFNRYFRDGKLPFRDVYVHAMIQDGHGQKMSKSLGNGVDPRDIIHSHGSDSLRFTLAQIATSTQDVRLPVDMICPHPGCAETFHPKEITSPAGYRVADAIQTCPKCKKQMVSGYGAASGIAIPTAEIPLARNSSSKFDEGRNLATKIWQVSAGFAIPNISKNSSQHDQSVDVRSLSLADRWILARLKQAFDTIDKAIADYQFKIYADIAYEFVRRDFCDWYVEAIKPTIKSSTQQQQVLRTVLNAIMRLLHPIMPFVTESLWPAVAACGLAGLDGIQLPASELLIDAPWPDIKCTVDDPAALATFERIQNLVNAIRQRRGENKVNDRKSITLHAPPPVLDLIHSAGGAVETLAKLKCVPLGSSQRPAGAMPLAFEGNELLLSDLVDAVDVGSERARLTKFIAEKQKSVASFRSKLENPGYLSKAPPDKVQETREMLAQAEADLAAASNALESLG